MLLHKLFNTDNPTCLYCQGSCWTRGWGEALMTADTHTCKDCGEAFQITGMYSATDEVDVEGFSFTCNGIKAHHNYRLKSFGLSKVTEDSWKHALIWIPEFSVDFSDKEGLFKKLKIYLTFG
jgi:hypothetical protein